MIIGVKSILNDFGFCIEVDDKKKEMAKELVREGFETWIGLSDTEFPTKNFEEEDGEWIYAAGYAEPSVYLLDKYNIPHGDVMAFEYESDYQKITAQCGDICWV